MKEPPVKRGDVLAGRYRVDSVLGVGGMGVVVAATHLELLEPRAIKFMLPEALESPEAVERFLREARASSRLVNEHVARVHDVGRLDNGAPYMVMEYLSGSDLRTLLQQRGRIPYDEAARYALQACEALAEAHGTGVIHRDLKPGNLFLTQRRDGSPCIKVLDFGISKTCGKGDPEMTATHAVMGSPSYMSPEQMRSARSVDARTDIWSLGVILYRLVTGELPFRAANVTELVACVLSTEPSPPSSIVPGIPAGFDEVLERCLQRDLARRWSDVGELAEALTPFAPEDERGAVERIGRMLAGTTAPMRRPTLKTGGSNTSGPTGSAPEPIPVRRWLFVALAGAAGGMALAGAVALLVSLHVAHSAARVEEPPVVVTSPPPGPPPAVPVRVAPEAPPPPPRPVVKATPKIPHPRPKPSVTVEPPPKPPEAPSASAVVQPLPRRLFGTED